MSEQWEDVANALVTHLEAYAGIVNASNGYPEKDIASEQLAYAIITAPDIEFQKITFGAYALRYITTLNVHIKAVSTNQTRLLESMTNDCINAAQGLAGYLSTNSTLTVNTSRVKLLPMRAKVARFTPSTDSNRGNFAGFTMTLAIQV